MVLFDVWSDLGLVMVRGDGDEALTVVLTLQVAPLAVCRTVAWLDAVEASPFGAFSRYEGACPSFDTGYSRFEVAIVGLYVGPVGSVRPMAFLVDGAVRSLGWAALPERKDRGRKDNLMMWRHEGVPLATCSSFPMTGLPAPKAVSQDVAPQLRCVNLFTVSRHCMSGPWPRGNNP